MIRVQRPPATDADLAPLVSAAGAARQALLDAFAAGEKPKIVEAHYRAYKSKLMAAFHDKCAYCDSLISDTHAGDIEHYRPKNRVRNTDLSKIEVNYPRFGRVEHMGYFWLAYEWDNLLPACDLCNRYHKYGDRGAGKGDRFPVKGRRAHLPNKPVNESPLLIDPTRIDPDPHFEFFEDGLMRGRTEEGAATIELLGLNLRERLVRERARAYDGARRALAELLQNSGDIARIKSLRAEVNGIWEGLEPHTAHGRLAIEAIRRDYRRFGATIPIPIPPLQET